MAAPIKHTRYFIAVTSADGAQPVLRKLNKALKDRRPLHEQITRRAVTETRRHIRQAAATRHTTAQALGAQPTNYLAKRAAAVSGIVDASGGRVRIAGAIFKRVQGPVTIVPVRAKLLTIPTHKSSYGKRAADFPDLFFRRSKKGFSFLAQKRGSRITNLFLLLKKVTLPADPGLLPTERQYQRWSEEEATSYAREALATAKAAALPRSTTTRRARR
jgi:hypothetical protein